MNFLNRALLCSKSNKRQIISTLYWKKLKFIPTSTSRFSLRVWSLIISWSNRTADRTSVRCRRWTLLECLYGTGICRISSYCDLHSRVTPIFLNLLVWNFRGVERNKAVQCHTDSWLNLNSIFISRVSPHRASKHRTWSAASSRSVVGTEHITRLAAAPGSTGSSSTASPLCNAWACLSGLCTDR